MIDPMEQCLMLSGLQDLMVAMTYTRDERFEHGWQLLEIKSHRQHGYEFAGTLSGGAVTASRGSLS
jgi:hypothetical protein